MTKLIETKDNEIKTEEIVNKHNLDLQTLETIKKMTLCLKCEPIKTRDGLFDTIDEIRRTKMLKEIKIEIQNTLCQILSKGVLPKML